MRRSTMASSQPHTCITEARNKRALNIFSSAETKLLGFEYPLRGVDALKQVKQLPAIDLKHRLSSSGQHSAPEQPGMVRNQLHKCAVRTEGVAVPIGPTYLHVWGLHGFSLIKELCLLKLGPIWPFSRLRFSADFALTEVICSSGNGSIMSSDSLLKCLPWIIRAIQSNLGITFACWRLKFHIFMVLVGDSERAGKTQMSNHKTPIIHPEKNRSQT